MQNQQGYYSRPNGPRQAPASGPDTPPSASDRQGGTGGPRRPSQKPPKKQGKNWREGPSTHFASALARVVATVFACIFLAVFILRSASDLFGLNQEDQSYSVVFAENPKLKEVTKTLGDLGVVDQKLTFRIYGSLKYDDKLFKSGDYIFNSDMSYDQILSKITKGSAEMQEIKLTFVEGLNLDQIAKQLEENNIVKADEFLEYLQTGNFSSYSFFSKIENSDELYFRMEGYVFPDTYQFYINEKVDSVAKKFLDNFERHMTPENLERMEDINMSLHDTIVLASIIEKEASGTEEMRRVSSVFHNRLDNSGNFPQLQSDVTIFYIEDVMKGKNRSYTRPETQELFDAYNTYKTAGLPLGPVSNPGDEAIKAALHPAETNYYYFVTDIEDNFYYASTLDEHNANIVTAEAQDDTGEKRIGGIMTPEGGDAQK